MQLTKFPEFDHLSARGATCYLLNIPRPKEDDYIVRTGVDIDFEGVLDLSVRAIKELARFIGWEDPASFESRLERAEIEIELSHAVRDDAVAQFHGAEEALKAEKAKVAVMQKKLDAMERRVANLEAELEADNAGD